MRPGIVDGRQDQPVPGADAMRQRRSSPANIATLLVDEPAARHPARDVLCGGARRTTYGELGDLTARAAAGLRATGCGRGDRVLIALPDSLEFIAAFFGAAKIGAVPVPVNPMSSAADLMFYLADIGGTVLVAESALASELRRVWTSPLTVVATGDVQPSSGTLGWDTFLTIGAPVGESVPVADDEPALLMYTSGSTAQQKAAIHSHRNVITAARHVGQGVFRFRADDRILSVPKMSFSFGFGFGLCFPLAAGCGIVLKPAPTRLEDIAMLIRRDGPTILVAVPSVLAALLKASRTWLPIDLSSLKYIASAGEPLPAQIFHEFADRFGLEVVDGLGSTELMTHVISNRPGTARPGTCGTAVPGCQVKLCDEADEELPAGQVGTLWVKSENAFLGYWNRAELTARARQGEWVRTGDQLVGDGEGYFRFCGRHDDMLKVGGVWVAATDVEEALCRHAAVDRAFVTVRADPSGIQRLVAYVVGRDGCAADDTDLLKHLAGQLPEPMIPSAFVTLAELPLTPNGKVRRQALPAPTWKQREPRKPVARPQAPATA
jgi:acyl-coenzyme A synthetase/AMP-(fatty) acid ligase